jgi:hypothetical protein
MSNLWDGWPPKVSGRCCSEALAQFVESVPEMKGVKKTFALKDLINKTEQDPRRLSDFTIDFNPFMESIEKKLSER